MRQLPHKTKALAICCKCNQSIEHSLGKHCQLAIQRVSPAMEESTLHNNNYNYNSNSTFIALNLWQKTDSKAHHTKTLFNIHKPETLEKAGGDWKFRVGMLFQRGMTSTLT